MLDRYKLMGQLDKVGKDVFLNFAKEQDIAQKVWESIKDDQLLSYKIHQKKYSLLLPKWSGNIGFSKKISTKIDEYGVLAVDGSQIYYDKHQGPDCYLINVGTILLDYTQQQSYVNLSSYPYLFFVSDQNREHASTDFINLQREEYEFEYALKLSLEWKQDKLFATMFDGSLIFFHLDSQGQDQKQKFLQSYLNYLHKFYEQKILIVGYMSFPKNKELVNIVKLVLAQFDEQELNNHSVFDQLTDMDVVRFFLDTGCRSTIFESKAPISYLYPGPLRPYFCYVHMGDEVVRLEFPAWIAQQNELVDRICQLAYDQAHKGRGYPVCLFEAHEQAVIKGGDREFFYAMLKRKVQNNSSREYQRSIKSLKKSCLPV